MEISDNKAMALFKITEYSYLEFHLGGILGNEGCCYLGNLQAESLT